MRYLLSLVALLSACGGGGGGESPQQQTQAEQLNQQSVALNSIDPNYADYSDLAAFGNAIGEKRIVVLTEPLHGVNNTMLLNSRLLRYLHQAKGFDVLLIESGMFDLSRMQEIHQQQGGSYLDSAPGRIFYIWSKTASGRKMVEYLDQTSTSARPLQMAGIDYLAAGISATEEFQPRYEAVLNSFKSSATSAASWPAYRRVLDKIIGFDIAQRPSDADLASFRELSQTIDAELCNTPYDAKELPLKSKSYWCRISKTIQQETHYLWHTDKGIDASVNEPWHEPRDMAQAANANWWLEGPFKGKKAIVWTHAYHGLQNAGRTGQINTASELAKYYPGQIHTAHVTTAQANFGYNNSELTKFDLEYYLGTTNRYMNYPADQATQSLLGTLAVRENALARTKPSHFGSSYQTLFFLKAEQGVDADHQAYPSKRWPQPLE